jgi:pimeloyl-ACP methyl ester carboxylesterase
VPENSKIMAEKIPRCTLVEFEGCGHGLIFQEPDKSAGVIQEFLAGE